jgi:hypothetical protein
MLCIVFLLGVASPYPVMAPIDRYRIASRSDEISLARSAAPASISAGAEVLVLGSRGYEIAAKGANGFVCFVERSWTAGFDAPEFWNPKILGPNCFNAAAARTELPQILKRTQWVMAGVSREQMIAKTRAAFAAGEFAAPAPGALSYMLSKRGYLSDDGAGPWLPHLMFFGAQGFAAYRRGGRRYTWIDRRNDSGTALVGRDAGAAAVVMISS